MRFGVCTSINNAAVMRSAGWDFIEEGAQGFLQGTVPDAQWDGPARLKAAGIPVYSVNMLVPGAMKIVGPDAQPNALRAYITTVVRRAAECGIKICVFGSAGARSVPDGFDRAKARDQIIAFLRDGAAAAGPLGVTIVVEALNRTECNIINSLPEAMDYVRAVDHPACKCLFDSYHFWAEKEPLTHLSDAAKYLAHVHVADLEGRVAPGASGTSDYRPALAILKSAGYEGSISVEASNFDVAAAGEQVLRFLKQQWAEA